MLRTATVILVCVLFFTACNSKSDKLSDNFDFGSIENHIYHNKYFGLEIKLPESWTVIDKEGQLRRREESKKIFGEKYKEMVEKMPDDIQNAALLTINKYHPDSMVQGIYNSSFAMVAENIKRAGKISAEKYLDQASKLMKQAGMDVDVPDAYGKIKIGGKDFTVMPVTMRVRGYAISQEYCVRIEKGFALLMLLTYGNEEQRRELTDILNAVKFE